MRKSLQSLETLAGHFFEWPEGGDRKTVTTTSAILFAEYAQQRALGNLRALHAAMVAAQQVYKKAEPDVVHHAHAEYKAARFRYNVACGEYVAGLLGGIK